MRHEFCYHTEFCLKCGAPATAVLDGLFECRAADNVIAISHVIAKRRMAEIIAPVMARLGFPTHK